MKADWKRTTDVMPPERDAGIMRKLGVTTRSETVIVTVEVSGKEITAPERYVATAYTLDGKWRCERMGFFQAGGYDVKVVAWTEFPDAYDEE